jgi:ribonuclease P protein component
MPVNTLPKSLLLRGPATFRAHYDLGHRETLGPLQALALASPLPHTRLGVSVPKRFGKANRRNRVRRLLKEAFRLSRPNHPPNVDIVLLVRPHETKSLADYQALLAQLWDRLRARQARKPLPSHPSPVTKGGKQDDQL